MITVADVFKNFTIEPILVHRKEGIKTVYHKLVVQKVPICRSVYVIDDNQRAVGRITIRKIMDYVAINKALTSSKPYSIKTLFQYTSPDLVAEDIMAPAIAVDIDQPLEEAFQILLDNNAEEAAVIDEDGRVVGDLNIYEILNEI